MTQIKMVLKVVMMFQFRKPKKLYLLCKKKTILYKLIKNINLIKNFYIIILE